MEDEIDLKNMIRYFWSKKIWIILAGILCVILAIIYTKYMVEPQYLAASSFILTKDNLETEAEVYSYAKLPDRYYSIVNSRTVLTKVIENLKLEGINDFPEFKEKCIKISSSPDNFLIRVTATTDNAKKSVDIANEMVKVSIEEIKRIYKDEDIKILDVARENNNPININFTENLIKFVFIGETLVCALILMLYVFVDGKQKEKLKELEEKERIDKEYTAREKEIVLIINQNQKYIDFVKERKVLEKNLKVGEYKKVSRINDEILKYYAKEAYILGYIDAKNSKEKSAEE